MSYNADNANRKKKLISSNVNHKLTLDHSNKNTTQNKASTSLDKDGINARNLMLWTFPNEISNQKQQSTNDCTHLKKESITRLCNESDSSRPTSRSSSSKFDLLSTNQSTTHNQNATTNDIRARYWAYLFHNLKRAVDEIYKTCENDESINECREAIMILDNCTNDFKSLIKRFEVMRKYERADHKSHSLAWELRKSSPQKTRDIENHDDKNENQDDLEEFNPMDLLNHETFSDINSNMNEDYDDLSINAYQTMTPTPPQTSQPSSSTHSSKKPTMVHGEGANQAITNKLASDSFNSSNSYEATQSMIDAQQLHQIQVQAVENHHFINYIKSLNLQSPQDVHNDEGLLMNSFKGQRKRVAKNLLNSSNDENDFYDFDETDVDENDVDEIGYLTFLLNKNASLEAHEKLSTKLKPAKNHFNFDTIDEVMLKVYEEEENLTKALEKEQDKKLRSVIAQEFKLTKQLSVEQLREFDSEQLLKQRPPSGPFESESETTVRTPGRALQMHEKLSSASRMTSPTERKRRHEEKQARAQEKREKFYEDRSQKLRDLAKKIEQVRKLKNDLLRAKIITMKVKLQRAEEKRQYLLQMKAKKAADEELKAHEILFINNLKEQNRKFDIFERYEKQEARKSNIEGERIRKQEEQKAKEQAAELRRKGLEAQRLAKLKEMQEKRRIKQTKIEQALLEKEKDRIETARAKEKTREQRLAQIEAQYQANKEEVKKRIIQKQEESSKRHESNLEEIRKKAFEMSILHYSTDDHHNEAPTPVPYEKAKYCSVCNVDISSEVHLQSHLRGLKHQQIMNEANQGKNLTKSEIEEYNLKCIVDKPKETNDAEILLNQEKKQSMRKRLKKLKSRITTRGNEYELSVSQATNNLMAPMNSQNKPKLQKLLKDLNKNLQITQNKITNIDRTSGEIMRLIEKSSIDQQIFAQLDGFSTCVNLLELIGKSNEIVSTKSAANIVSLLISACNNNFNNCYYMILSNKLAYLLEILSQELSVLIPDSFDRTSNTRLPQNACVTNLIQLIASVFTCLSNELSKQGDCLTQEKQTNLFSRATDMISFIVSLSILDKISVYFCNIRGPLTDDLHTGEMLINCLNLLTIITKFLCLKKSSIFSEKKIDDTTQLITTFKATNLVGIVSMLYGLLHRDSPPFAKNDQSSSSPLQKLPQTTYQISIMSLKMLNQMAVLDLNMAQDLLGEECLSLQLRHISSYFLWYCPQTNSDELLYEIILLIGYFTVLRNENQIKIELGTPPTMLQLLCNLPFGYFSDEKLTNILHPTLICYCYKNEKNKNVLETEISSKVLANYIEESLEKEEFKTKLDSNDQRFDFNRRFPNKLWLDAYEYFSGKRLSKNR